MPTTNRKAAIRNAPNWLDMLELPADAPAEVEIDVSDLGAPGPLAPNAAELWAASLPDLAIVARRRELTAGVAPTVARVYAPDCTASEPARRHYLGSAASAVLMLVMIAASALACIH